jgi:hypothetical protein
MKKPLFAFTLAFFIVGAGFGWGFFAHQKINRLAVFTLPPEMIGFYKQHIQYITEAAVNPDKRRYAVPEEAARHYIDLDHFGDSALYRMPRYWNEAVKAYGEDTLKAYGILPWHIQRMYNRLKEAFLIKDPKQILQVSAEIGHYLADAHVPLHTTENYNGQLTGQEGIHGFWESRLPELFSGDYDFFVGRASYIENVQLAAWNVIITSHLAVDSVLSEEKRLSERLGGKKYSFETKGKMTQKVYSREYSTAYHKVLDGMVERRMRSAIKTIGDFWYSAWVDGGQPDLSMFNDYTPSDEELKKRKEEVEAWKKKSFAARDHEEDEIEP